MKTRLSRFLSGFLIVAYLSSAALTGVVHANSTQTGKEQGQVTRHEPKRGVNPETGKVSFIGGGDPITVKAPGVRSLKDLSLQERGLAIANAYGREFGLGNPAQELKLRKSEKDSTGKDILRYQQMYKGIPVLSGEMIINMNSNGDLLSISGEVSSDLTLDTKPTVKAEEARKTALAEVARVHQIDETKLQSSDPELWIFDESILVASARPVELVWRMEVTPKDAILPIREMVLVNAQTGELSFHINQVDTGEASVPSVNDNNFSTSSKFETTKTTELQQLALPLYFDLVVDETRGWIYGSDSNGNKIDVISMATLELVKSITLVSGASPKGIALSPDGSELAIAQYGASSILFINPDTNQTIATIVPNAAAYARPWDLLYGRSGRLYASGTTDYIHVVDTNAHSEISRSTNTVGGEPYLAISSTQNFLFANSTYSPNYLYRFDVSTDNLPTPISTGQALHDFTAKTYVVAPDDSKIFTSGNQVWNSDLSSKIGGLTPAYDANRIILYGRPVILPNHDVIAVAVDNISGSDVLAFVSTNDFYTLTRYTLPGTGTLGALIANAAGTKLYVSTSNGITALDLTSSLPGTPVPLPSGPLPYYELIRDEPRGVLYGSDSSGNKIDVISLSTLQVIDSFRFVNGTRPEGIALSPDGNELAVAHERGLLFLNPDTGETTATLPGWSSDVIYGRTNRVYATNADSTVGIRIDVIDSLTHTRIATSSGSTIFAEYLTISTDENTLFMNGDDRLYKLDISTDLPPAPTTMTAAPSFYSNKSVVLIDDTKIFTDYSQVWSSDFKTQLGSIAPGSNLKRIMAPLPNHDAVALGVDNDYGNDEVWFIDTNDFYTRSKYTLPTTGTLGPMVASADGSMLYVNTSTGVVALGLTPSLPGTAVSLPSGPLPYKDIVLDEARGVLYGADFTGNKIDVVSMTTLEILRSFRLVNGAKPKALALSPDGSELAIAQSSASSILFLDPDTGETIATLTPNVSNKIPTPADIIYGRTGRLYSTGNGYIHVINTLSHTEISKSVPISGFYLTISSDKNYLFTNEIGKIDVSTDTILDPIKNASLGSTANETIVLVDDTKIFTDRRDVWNDDLSAMIGKITPIGFLVNLPNHEAIAVGVDNYSGNDAIAFVSTSNFYTLSTYTLPGSGTLGPLVAASDGSKLFVNASTGLSVLDLAPSLPGTPASLPSGPLPYFDLIADDARGVLYGSDLTGNKIDVISKDTLEVIKSFRLANGAAPRGIALSPDGSELVIAQSEIYSILFLDPDTGETIATMLPNLVGSNQPWDVVYGRPGRLYVSCNSDSKIHIIDTVAHAEINKFTSFTGDSPYLAMTSDKGTLFARGVPYFNKFDVSTDTPVRTAYTTSMSVSTFLILADDSKIFTDTGQIWSSDLTTKLGTVAVTGKLVEIPGLGLVAVLSNSGSITFVRLSDYTITSTAVIPSTTSVGASLVSSTGDSVFVNTNNGIKSLDIRLTTPSSISLYSGSSQSVQVSNPFQDLLQVKIKNVLGDPIAGAVVTFTAPTSGATGKFTDSDSNSTTAITDIDGIATSSVFVANESAGSYLVKATITNLAASADFQLTNLAVVTCTIATGPISEGIFLPYKQYRCGMTSQGVGAGDFNHDGREDVALSVEAGTGRRFNLLIFIQDGNGNLSQPRVYAGGNRAESLVAGDVNNDGRADVITADFEDNKISVFLQNNNGTLANRVTYSTDTGPDSLAIGDVNNDGLQDIVVSHWNAPSIGVFLQNADGTLSARVSYAAVQTGYNDMAIGDVNGDGLNDVVKMNGSGLSGNLLVYLQNSDHTLAPYTSYSLANCTSSCRGTGIGIGDVTGDGRADVVMSYGGNSNFAKMAVFPQGSDGTLLASISYPSYDIPQTVEIRDMNSDNLLDVVTLHGGWRDAGVYLQKSNGSLYTESLSAIPYKSNYSPQDLSIGDVNNDGLPDALVADDTGLVILYRNTVIPPPPTPITPAPPGPTPTPRPPLPPGSPIPPDYTGSRRTYTASGQYAIPGTLLCDQDQLVCTNGVNLDADHAHRYTADTFVFFNTHHGRNSFDNQGGTIDSTVDFGTGYENAFWDGYQLVFGDGMAADDVVAHEFTHGVTQYTSDLIYAFQSGAINESFSDVWGEFIDQTNNSGDDSASAKWWLGEDSALRSIRNMSDPTFFGDPDKMSSPYYYTGSGDNGGVHINSGVNNKAAYLMVEGGTFNGRTIHGIGLNKTAAVYYEVQVYHLTMGANYSDLYYALIQGCMNLIGGPDGITQYDCEQVRLAAEAVEMVPAPPPAVTSIVRASADPNSTASVDFTVNFSEPVIGIETTAPFSDFTLTTTAITGATITGISGSGATRTVTVNTGSGNGTLRLDVPVNATITDLDGKPLSNLPFRSGEAYTFDRAPGAGIYDDADSRWTYSGNWTAATSLTGPYANTDHYAGTVGNYAEWTFKGAKFKLFYLKANNRGLIDILVDGTKIGQINAYSGTLSWQATWTSPTLTPDTHTVRFVHAGGHQYIDIDALQVFDPPPIVPAGHYDDTDAAWTFSSGWTTYNGGGPANNTNHYTNIVGSETQLSFNGTRFIFTYLKASNRGLIDVLVDGTKIAQINAKSSTTAWQQTWTSPILESGAHTVRFVHAGASGTYIDVDKIQVLGASDTTAPAAIADLLGAAGTATESVDLSWTAPGDDGSTGTATSYLVRYSTAEINTDIIWNAATPVSTGIPTPAVAGTPQTMTVSGLTPGVTYFFVVRALDEESNLGGLSNSPAAAAQSPSAVPAGTYDDADSNWTYLGAWTTYNGSGPANSTSHYTSTAGNEAQITFTGVKFKFTYVKASNRGLIDVYVDGTKIAQINAKSTSTTWQATWASPELTPGTHTVRFVHAGGGTYIDVDAIQIFDSLSVPTSGTYDDADAGWTFSSGWTAYTGTGPVNNTDHYTNVVGGDVQFTFTGTGFTFTYVKAANRGLIDVYVDGVKVTQINARSSSTAWQQTWTHSGLASGTHTVRFVNAGGGYIDVDAITIVP